MALHDFLISPSVPVSTSTAPNFTMASPNLVPKSKPRAMVDTVELVSGFKASS